MELRRLRCFLVVAKEHSLCGFLVRIDCTQQRLGKHSQFGRRPWQGTKQMNLIFTLGGVVKQRQELSIGNCMHRDPGRQIGQTQAGDGSQKQRLEIIASQNAVGRFFGNQVAGAQPTPAQSLGIMALVQQAMANQFAQAGRVPMPVQVSAAGADGSALRAQPLRIKPAVLGRADADHRVEAFAHGIGQPLGEFQFDAQCGMACEQVRQLRWSCWPSCFFPVRPGRSAF